MTNAEPGHCITSYAAAKDNLYVPNAVWTFTNLSDAQSWRSHLRQQWKSDGYNDRRARIFDRTLRVSGVTIVLFCLVLDDGPAPKSAAA